MGLKAGAARLNITPAVGCLMDGYGGRTHGAEGIRDELWTRALYLANDTTEIVLISVEILGLTRESVTTIQERVHHETGIPRSHVVVSATHTHSGPKCRVGDSEDSLTRRNMGVTVDKIASAAIWARSRAVPARLRRLQASTLCGVNRRERRDGRIVLGINPSGPVDPSVDILSVVSETGESIAVWYAHACHPVVMGSSNYLISGDFAGAASRFIEEATGSIALFANGAAGNINSRPHNGTFEDVDRLGARLGATVVECLTHSDESPELTPHLAAGERKVFLPVDPVPNPQEADRHVESAQAELRTSEAEGNANRTFWARRALKQAEEVLALSRAGEHVTGAPLVLTLAEIGDLALVGVPAEVFVELGLEVRQNVQHRRAVLLSYTGGYQGYLPTEEAFIEGGYEVDVRIRHRGLAITSRAGHVVVDECIKLIQSVQSD